MALISEEGAILNAVGIVETGESDLKSGLQKLRGDIEAISRQSFEGRTATQFRTLMAQWDQDANRLVSALENFAADLRKTQEDFDSKDDAQAASMNIETSRINFTY